MLSRLSTAVKTGDTLPASPSRVSSLEAAHMSKVIKPLLIYEVLVVCVYITYTSYITYIS